MSFIEELYGISPVWIQNLMVSVYGYRRQWLRYGGAFNKHLKTFLKSQWWSADEFLDYQLYQLKTLIEHSIQTVPYYRKLLGASPPKITSLNDLKSLPLLDKETLRTQLNDCLTEKYSRGKLIELHTSGSTGTPLTYFISIDDFRKHMALLERQRHWAGVHKGCRCATFTGRLIIPRKQSTKPYWRYNFLGNQMLLSVYYLSHSNIKYYIERLIRYRPIFIEGYPSALYIVARWIIDNEMEGRLNPRAILVTGETLFEEHRNVIEKAFSAPVFNYYGSSDGAPLITECEFHNLHLNPESGIFEFIRQDGSEASPGEIAEMVVTSFHSRAMPLIRYRIGDFAIKDASRVCPCGRKMPIVRSIIGRLDDFVYTRERGWVGRLSQVVKVFPGSIRESQIIQKDIDTIIVRLVPDPSRFSENQLIPMIYDLKRRLGDSIQIRVEIVDHIERGPNGKFRYVISQLKPSPSILSFYHGAEASKW